MGKTKIKEYKMNMAEMIEKLNELTLRVEALENKSNNVRKKVVRNIERLPNMQLFTPWQWCKSVGKDKVDMEELIVNLIEEGIIEEVDRGNGFEGYRVQNKNLGGKNGFNMGNFYVKFPAEVYEAPQD